MVSKNKMHAIIKTELYINMTKKKISLKKITLLRILFPFVNSGVY